MTTLDVDACDVEPIRIPGAIQPHGVLVALAEGSLEILQTSANCATYFGVTAEAVTGRQLCDLIGVVPHGLWNAIHSAPSAAGEPIVIDLGDAAFDVVAHRHEGVIIIELERSNASSAISPSALRHALSRLQRSNTMAELCSIAVAAVRDLTGFDRVMLYRFDAEGHGVVVDEARADDVDSYRGQWFPASDIPRQAREMYELNWLRLIPNAAYTPVPLVPALRPDTHGPLDLAFATLRSVSPIHLEYLHNMGVRASMSVSLVESDALWGLIACHHRSPRHVSFAARAGCEVIGRVVALQIAALRELDIRATREAMAGTEASLVAAMRDSGVGVARALARNGDALVQLVGASAAAVIVDDELHTHGAVPSATQIRALVSWLGDHATDGMLCSDQLAKLHPAAADYADVASGLLAMTLPGNASVIWFRPEITRTVTWAGNPEKPVEMTESGTRLHPRHSFARWTQIVRGRSLPWHASEIGVVEDLRRRAIEVDLADQIVRAEQAVQLRDDMVAVLSHDLKGPLHVLEMATTLLRTDVGDRASAVTTLGRIEQVVDRMNVLVNDLLDLAKLESGRFAIVPTSCMTSRLVSEAASVLAPLAEAKHLGLAWNLDDDTMLEVDPERIFQVLSNLVGNAIKFTPAGGVVRIDITRLGTVVRFAVQDSGPGIDPAALPHIFDRYWQARRGQGAGSGLGLYIARGIVEAHGQTIWAESTMGAGATFYFTLPVHVSAQP